ncbi:FKBP-type peptidyl-prolyl cis-trans isomerase [Daejeonella sp.]|uniref:FKBP-type peptidyl-prolyl cis-trans isomerase n=1 Tax=Daejeonella sp. TaxID=2805397 RepID=UPI0030C5E19A
MKNPLNAKDAKAYTMQRFIITLLLSLSFCLASIAQTRPVKLGTSLKLTTPNDSLQYTIGAYLGQWVTNNGFAVTNSELFLKGMNDVLGNKHLLIPSATVAAKLDSYQKRLISARGARQEQILFQNVRNQSGIGALPSGVNYFVMKPGAGIRPQAADSVLIHVKGFLPDGKSFEDTYAKKTPLRGTPGTFIPGMNEILQIMPVGSTWRVFIPSVLAYAGTGVQGLIPPNSAIIFEVELLAAARQK